MVLVFLGICIHTISNKMTANQGTAMYFFQRTKLLNTTFHYYKNTAGPIHTWFFEVIQVVLRTIRVYKLQRGLH